MGDKTPGQLAYEEDVRRMPLYYDGYPRVGWESLTAAQRGQWEQNPTAREWDDEDREMAAKAAAELEENP